MLKNPGKQAALWDALDCIAISYIKIIPKKESFSLMVRTVAGTLMSYTSVQHPILDPGSRFLLIQPWKIVGDESSMCVPAIHMGNLARSSPGHW